jgi:hypothetical protein
MAIYADNRKNRQIHALDLSQAANVFSIADMTDDQVNEILKHWGQKVA